jgi:hypothetical protein
VITTPYTAAEAIAAAVALHQSLPRADPPKRLVISYSASVFTPAGWRGVTIKARAKQVSPGFAEVIGVLAIDDEEPRGTMSRTGARRQEYWGTGVAKREAGKRKRISACTVLAESDAVAA